MREYRASLKDPDAEEVFDLLLYRPLAWFVVRGLRHSPVTPNQVTGLSLAATLGAAWCFGAGSHAMLAAGAGLYAAGNVLDCADGQLARVRGGGSPDGRLVDGTADYLGTAAVFLGIGIGFASQGWNLWPETIAAGVSSALHAMIFDRLQGEYLATRSGARGGDAAPAGPPAEAGPGRMGTIRMLYGKYEEVQRRFMGWLLPGIGGREGAGTPSGGGSAVPSVPDLDATLIRLWSFLGPTTNKTALIAFALLGRVDLFLWAVILPGNLWLLALRYLHRRLVRPGGAEPAG